MAWRVHGASCVFKPERNCALYTQHRSGFEARLGFCCHLPPGWLEFHSFCMARIPPVLTFFLRWIIVGLAVACVLLLAVRKPDSGATGPAPGMTGYADAVARTAPAVVNIVTERLVATHRPQDRNQAVQQSLGSGVIVDARGLIVTAQHVIACAQAVHVQLADGRTTLADIVGSDPATDVAVLRIGLATLPVAPLGSSDALRPGDVALAIGTPFGLTQTVTHGIISATGRGQLRLAPIESYIQTDAAINVGNSGGALINASGDVIGINTAALSNSSGSHGISFAIPINLVRGVLSAIMKDGRVIRGWFGVEARTLLPAEALPQGLSVTHNLKVATVAPDSPADHAGLRAGDIILAINERARTWDEALNVVAETPPGQTITLDILRNGERRTYRVTLVERTVDTTQCDAMS